MTASDSLAGRTVLVTGASGFLGTAVCRLGVGLGCRLHGLTRTSISAPGIRVLHGDLSDASIISEIVADLSPDVILHLAAAGVSYGSGQMSELVRVNVLGLTLLLDAAARLANAPVVVIAGSGFEYGPRGRPLQEDDLLAPSSPYGASKAAATMVASGYADRLPVAVLRLFSLYGPGEREPRLAPFVIGEARRGRPIELTGGEQVRDYTFVDDAAEAFWVAASRLAPDRGLRVFNVGSGQPLCLRDFVAEIADVLRGHGIESTLLFGQRPYRTDETMHYVADVSRIGDDLGWRATTPLRRGLEAMVELSLGQP